MRRGVHSYRLIQLLNRKKIVLAVGDGIEAVSRPQDFHPTLLPDEIPHFLRRGGRLDAVRAVLDIPRPVRNLLASSPGNHRRNKPAPNHSREQLQKGSLIHHKVSLKCNDCTTLHLPLSSHILYKIIGP